MKTFLAAALLTSAFSLPVQANLIVNGDFEDLSLAKGWKVYRAIPGWTTTGSSGIEIQTSGVLKFVKAQSGRQYVELDSHSNSTMTQGLSLVSGQHYELSFWYFPRTNNNKNDNGVNVYWDIFNGDLSLFKASNEVLSIDDQKRRDYSDWRQYTLNLVASSNLMALTFAGDGLSNSLGGLIDNVSLIAKPIINPIASKVPEPATLALFGLSLAALGMAHRRKA